ncbi:TFIIB-type zinc ribbon-containing protein [Allokutzneria oryzae]|uniref:TFIIB-type zinc ribbon-containing protein n=1 Tax=Allokutzneria oryzae TaxID=1378989 RepID=A0ABV5ZNJ5_9PSEU
MSSRFRDRQVTAWEFTDEVLVHCPRCRGRAVLVPPPGTSTADSRWRRRLVCPACGHAEDLTSHVVAYPGNQGRPDLCDPFDLGLRLFLQVPCRGEVLWAFNHAHVDYLESCVAASLRERSRRPDAPNAWHRRMTMTAKLPAWVKSAKNRDEVRRALARLRAL